MKKPSLNLKITIIRSPEITSNSSNNIETKSKESTKNQKKIKRKYFNSEMPTTNSKNPSKEMDSKEIS